MTQPPNPSGSTLPSPEGGVSLVVLISGNGSNLDSIIQAIKNNKIQHATIRAVISNRPDAYGLERAAQQDIPAICLDHKQFENREAFDKALLERVQSYQPDLVILAGFMRILTPNFVRSLIGKLINVHPSLLPKYQGLNTHQRAIDAGELEHGCSVHFVTEELDGGPVIAQSAVRIDSTDTAQTLEAKVRKREHKLLPLCIQWFSLNRLTMIDNVATLDGANLAPQGQRPTDDVLDHM